jgi:hypothetical protein
VSAWVACLNGDHRPAPWSLRRATREPSSPSSSDGGDTRLVLERTGKECRDGKC